MMDAYFLLQDNGNEHTQRSHYITDGVNAQAASKPNHILPINGRNAILPYIGQEMLEDMKWKDAKQLLLSDPGKGTVTSTGSAFDALTSAHSFSAFADGTQHITLMQQDSQTPDSETMDHALLFADSCSGFSTQESARFNYSCGLGTQEEDVAYNNPFEEEKFNSELVLAFLWIEAKLCAKLKYLRFCEKVACIYNPLEYASDPHAHYVSKYCGTKTILFLGMNPGPFGMAQNGVPFGDTRYVREWLKISGKVQRPEIEHPKRPIHGLGCSRSEVCGSRFWGFIAKICGTPEQFFQNCFVHNYCPLALMTKTGKNLIPAALPAIDRHALEAECDIALLQCIRTLRCQIVVGIGKYASDRAIHVLKASGDESSASIRVERILHPSPASPQANSGWEQIVTRQLQECGILQYLQSPG